MRKTSTRLSVASFVALLAGVALVLVAGDQERLAMQGFPEGCVFDQSCDITPGVVAARHLLQVGWTVVGAGAVIAGLATMTSGARWGRQTATALIGLTLLVVGAAAKAVLLGGYVPPPTVGCQATRTCAADPRWTTGSTLYDAVLALSMLGSIVMAVALLTLLRPSRRPGARRPSRRATPAAP